jgi:phage terminase large subunit-like protein
LRAGQIRHGANPVLSWMAGNCAVRQDQNENIMPTKKQSTGRIDGIIAAIIGLSRAKVPGGSVYDQPGNLML